jgi:hypothetical protein
MPVADCGDYGEIPVSPQEKETHILTENKTQINNLIKRFS